MGSIRAWQDLDDRTSLSEAERAARLANPAGERALTEEDLGAVVGGLGQYSDPCQGGEGKRS